MMMKLGFRFIHEKKEFFIYHQQNRIVVKSTGIFLTFCISALLLLYAAKEAEASVPSHHLTLFATFCAKLRVHGSRSCYCHGQNETHPCQSE